MSPVLTKHAPEPVRHLRQVAVPVAAVVGLVVMFAGVLRLVEPSATIDRVILENRSGVDVEVGVSDAPGGAELPLAAVDPGATTLVEDVLDQGSAWRFHVTRAGEELGTLERTRDRLQGDGWRVIVPADWGDRVPTDSSSNEAPG